MPNSYFSQFCLFFFSVHVYSQNNQILPWKKIELSDSTSNYGNMLLHTGQLFSPHQVPGMPLQQGGALPTGPSLFVK